MTSPACFYRPKPGLVIRDPADGQPLPAQGKAIGWSSYWQRRLDAGDIEPTDEKSVLAGDRKAAAGSVETKGDSK